MAKKKQYDEPYDHEWMCKTAKKLGISCEALSKEIREEQKTYWKKQAQKQKEEDE